MPGLRNPKHQRVALALFAGQTPEQASAAAGYDSMASSFAPNARKRAQRPDIRREVARLQAERNAKEEAGAGIGLEYLLAKIKTNLEFNLDDYLGPVDERGMRHFDLGKVPRDILGRLGDLAIEPGKYGTKIRLSGRDPAALMMLAARLQGLIKDRHELQGADGGPVVIERIERVIVDNSANRDGAGLPSALEAGEI